MKHGAVVLFVLLFPVAVLAQGYPGMNEADMQRMMEQMQKMQECMQQVDQAELEALGQRSEEVEREVRELCEQGKRDAAQKRAMAWGKEVSSNPSFKQMKKCSEYARDAMPQGQMQQDDYTDFDFSKSHVCDD
ncbi:MAG: hypothetical protein Kow0089_17420 [Desulfobulbaceae bacterium]